jgi:HEAT repeat protein
MRNAALVVGLSVLLVLSGCKGDPSKPEYWGKAIAGAKQKKDKIRLIEDLREQKIAHAGFLPMLHERLAQEKSADTKMALARLIGELKDPSSLQPLLDAVDLGNTDSDAKAMNKELTLALTRTGDVKVVPTFLKLMKTKDNYTVIAAIEGLGELKARDAVDALMELAISDTTEPFISKKAIQALGDIGDPKAVPVLVKMMYRERRQVSFYIESSFALYQMGAASSEVVLPVLEKKDKDLLQWAKGAGVVPEALIAKAAQVVGDQHEARAEKTLLEDLPYKHDDPSIKYFVRIRMADALGRLRSAAAVKPLSGMLDEDESNTRAEYCRALSRIGSHDAVPAPSKSAATGPWDGRSEAMVALAMLGDGNDLAALDKLLKDEEKLTLAECKEDEAYRGCDKPAELVKKHLEFITNLKPRLEAAKECKADTACWVKKLDDKVVGVRERAAYTIGRSKNPALVDELLKRLSESNLDTRLAIIQGADWLIFDSKDAAARAKQFVPALDKQIADEKGKTEFVKVNEDLRRLAVLMKRS